MRTWSGLSLNRPSLICNRCRTPRPIITVARVRLWLWMSLISRKLWTILRQATKILTSIWGKVRNWRRVQLSANYLPQSSSQAVISLARTSSRLEASYIRAKARLLVIVLARMRVRRPVQSLRLPLRIIDRIQPPRCHRWAQHFQGETKVPSSNQNQRCYLQLGVSPRKCRFTRRYFISLSKYLVTNENQSLRSRLPSISTPLIAVASRHLQSNSTSL